MLMAIIVVLILILLAIIFPGFVRKLLIATVFLIGFIVVIGLFSPHSREPAVSSFPTSSRESPISPVIAPTPAYEPPNSSNLRDASSELNTKIESANAPGNQWSYFHDNDAMGKSAIYQAQVSSTNTVNFAFPYEGAQRATLTLRVHPRYGNDVILSIEKGQFLCSSYDGCSVLVRFDNDNAVKFAAASAADHSSETLFIRNYTRFIGSVLKAKHVRIAASVYHQGEPMFDFDVEGFDNNKFQPKQPDRASSKRR